MKLNYNYNVLNGGGAYQLALTDLKATNMTLTYKNKGVSAPVHDGYCLSEQFTKRKVNIDDYKVLARLRLEHGLVCE